MIRSSLGRFCAFAILFAASETSSVFAEQAAPEGGDFRVAVEIAEILSDGSEKVFDRRVVIFYANKAYDFAMLAPNDVTVVDPVGGHVTMLSRKQNVRSVIPHLELVEATGRMRAYLVKEKRGKELGVGVPVQVIAGEDGNSHYEVAFTGKKYTSTVSKPLASDHAARFAEFNEWVARVNLYRRLGSPPFARMALGSQISDDGLIPGEIELQIDAEGQKRRYVTRYTFAKKLTRDDQKRVDDAAGMMTLYTSVPPANFPR
ncbi:MAG: hypothetical protein AAFV88_00475 [Planctomycetota bacterium]